MARAIFMSALAALATSIVASPLSLRQVSVPPSKDPFYSSPPGYQNAAPGTILKYRKPPSPIAVFATIPANIESSWQLLYRTSDSEGHPSVAVTTVLIPHNANFSRVVSYQDFEDSASPDCAPSYVSQLGSGNNGTLSQVDYLFEAGLLNEGFVVALPDYEGLKAAFAAGPQAGYATLDNIRAVLNSTAITGVHSNASVVMQGYSGGSIATEWAAEMQPSYAPELNILGAAVGGVIANVTSVVYTINKTPFAGFTPAGVLGLKAAYPDILDAWYERVIIPSTRSTFEKASTQCATQDLQQFSGQDIGMYAYGGLSVIQDPEPQNVIARAGIMGQHGLPTIPLYVYKAVADEISPVADTDKLVNDYCAKGIKSLEYYRNILGEHVTEQVTGSVGALAFLKSRFEGKPAYSGCKIETIALERINDPFGELGAVGDEILAALASLLLLPVGPESFSG